MLTKIAHRRSHSALIALGCVLSVPGQALLANSAITPQETPVSGGNPQDIPGQGYHLHVTTKIVVLDVVVTDKHGNLVHRDDLTKNDFTICENGVSQQIRSFDPPTRHQMPSPGKVVVNSASDLKKIGDAPVSILVLDELNSKFEDMSFSREMMIKYLQEQPAVLREPTVLMIAENSKFEQVHDYTQNRDELISVIKKHMPEYPWRMMNNGRSGPGAVERIAQVLASLQQLAQSSGGTPGRKNLIWVGNGFPSVDLTGLDQVEADVLEAAVRRVTAQMLTSRITMYTINPTAGSSATVDIESPDDLNSNEAAEANMNPFGSGAVSFTDFASLTGGYSFQGRNDLNNVIAEGIAKGEDYYTLSYTPSDQSEDPSKYRNIVIVMKDPNLRATTRKGYFPASGSDLNPLEDKTASDKQKQRDLELDLSQALTSTISYDGLQLTAQKHKNGEYTLHVAEDHVTWSEPTQDGSQHAEATVAAAWYDAKGKVLGHVAREETFPRGADRSGATYVVTLPALPPDYVRIRFVVRDAMSARMGTTDLTK
jgi:VWFA-related protein